MSSVWDIWFLCMTVQGPHQPGKVAKTPFLLLLSPGNLGRHSAQETVSCMSNDGGFLTWIIYNILILFSTVFIENHVFIHGNWVGMTPERSRILLKVILVLETASKVDFGPQSRFFSFFKTFIFQFSSKTHFLNHKFQDLSCRICSYGPYGPFWFSVKKWFW